MISGQFRFDFPRVTLTVSGDDTSASVDFIVDTAFDGDLTLPRTILARIGARPLGYQRRKLAGGLLVQTGLYEVVLQWGTDLRTVEVLAMDDEPLLGTLIMRGCALHVELSEGGEVIIELPD